MRALSEYVRSVLPHCLYLIQDASIFTGGYDNEEDRHGRGLGLRCENSPIAISEARPVDGLMGP